MIRRFVTRLIVLALLLARPLRRAVLRGRPQPFPDLGAVLRRRIRRAVLQGRSRPPRPGPAPGPGAALAGQAPPPAGPGICVPVRARVPVGPPGGAAPRRPRPARARFWPGVFRCATAYAVRLGRAQYGRRAYARMEDQQLILAPQRTGKSGIIADRLLDHPGPAIVTSTRVDLYELTAAARSRLGPLYVFNPQDVGGLPSTFAFDLLAPCRDLVMAKRMAGWFTGAIVAENTNHGNLEWFEKKGDVALMALLYAAAIGGYTITDVYRWVQLDGHENALLVLGRQPGNELLIALLTRMFAENKTAGSVRETIDLSLAWAVIPALAAAVTPRPGEAFDLGEFIADNGTLYLIAAGDEDSPLAPLFRAFTSWAHWEAGLIGSTTPARRLDPPLWLGLDEVTQICPIDLPRMLADSAGKGVLMTAVAHGTSQLEDRYGEAGAKTVWNCCGTKVILGGISDADTLEDISRAVRDHRHRRRRRSRPDSPAGADPGAARLARPGSEDEPQPGHHQVPAQRGSGWATGSAAAPSRSMCRARLSRRRKTSTSTSTMPLELPLPELARQIRDAGLPPKHVSGDFPVAGSLTRSHLTGSGGDD